ncbi:MAG TPA: DUF2239 family protein [Longimicrobiaceae bacterium]
MSASFSAFEGHRRLASGPLREAALAVKRAVDAGAAGPLLVFDDATGRVVDVDTRGTEAEVLARLPREEPESADGEPDRDAEPRRRGRPRLGVVAREVTLLPRHWEWLAAQPGGASVALRKLVEEARRGGAEADRRRRARDAAYRFMSAMAGDLPGFEEASRALFAGDARRFGARVAAWPPDVRDHVLAMAFGGGGTGADTAG